MRYVIAGLLMLGLVLGVYVTASSTEELDYKIIHKDGDFEIRYYPDYIEATVTLPIAQARTRGGAFNILAGYIFGGNQSREKIAMTAPVITETSAPVITETEQGIPVIDDASGAVVTQEDGNLMRMSFSMPSAYRMADLPTPRDNRITLRTVPGHYKATMRFGGRATAAQYQAAHTALLETLANFPDFKAQSGLMTAGYDAPWTPARYRRNEAMVTLVKN